MLRNRILIGLCWILSLVGISFYGGNITYGLFIMITLLPVMSGVYLLFVYLRFSVYQRLEGKTFVTGHAIPYFFTLQNENHFAFAGVRVYFHSDFSSLFGLDEQSEYELLPGTGIEKDTVLICRYRGSYEVGISMVEITDFLRLFRVRYHNREPLTVTVDPDIIPLKDAAGTRLARLLLRDSLRGENRPDIPVREYAPGDSIRSLQWKAIAREQKLLVRQYTGEQQESVGILLSTFRRSDKAAEYLPIENRMLEIALSLSDYTTSHNIPTISFTRTDALSVSRIDSHASFEGYYRSLCRLSYASAYRDEALFTEAGRHEPLRSTGTVFMILSEYTAEAEHFASILSGNGTDVIIYLVTMDRSNAIPETSLSGVEIVSVTPDDRLQEVL